MHFVLFPLTIVLTDLFFDFWARMVFVAVVYPRKYGHGKTGNRAAKHYKKNWTLLQRLLWLPAFKEYYAGEYRALAIFSYIQYIFGAFVIAVFELSMVFFQDSKIWMYLYGVYAMLIVVRIFHNNGVARGKI